MLRILAHACYRQPKTRVLFDITSQRKFPAAKNLILRNSGSLSGFQYRNPEVIEEESFNYKVLKYIRDSYPSLSACQVPPKPMSIENVIDEKNALRKLLLTVAHSPEVKVSDVLSLFSLYVSSQNSVTQNFISASLYVSSQNSVTQNFISGKSLMRTIHPRMIDSFQLMNVQELQQLATSMKKLKSKNIPFLNNLANRLSEYCGLQAKTAGLTKALQLFDVLLILHGNNVYRRKEFDIFMSIFQNESNKAHVYDLVQILHYIGLGKITKLFKEFAEETVRKLIPHYDSLSFCDAGIAAGGIFRSGVAIDKSSSVVALTAKHLLRSIKDSSIHSELESYAFISMIKVLCKANHEDDQLLSHLSQFILGNSESNFSSQVIPHVLAFYANMRVYEKDVFHKFENLTLEHLKNQPSLIRIKDICRVLWCFGYTGHKCSPEFLALIDKYLLGFANGPGISKQSHHLSDSLLSLAVCNHYPTEAIKKAFDPSLTESLKGHLRSKRLSRLFMLAVALQIEMPELAVEKPPVSETDLASKTLSDEIYYRRWLGKLMEGARFINEAVGADILRLKFLLPNYNFSNLVLDFRALERAVSKSIADESLEHGHIIQQLSEVGKSGRNLFAFEVFEPKSLIKPTSNPIGMISLKLRLLRGTGWDIRIIRFEEIEECEGDVRAIAALLMDKIVDGN